MLQSTKSFSASVKHPEDTYVLKTDTRNQIINYLKTLVFDHISQFDQNLSLIGIVYLDKSWSSGWMLSIPMLVTVRGPVEVSKQTEAFVKRIMDDFDLDIRQFLQQLDPDAFDGSNPILFETNDSAIQDKILIVRKRRNIRSN